ncbi:MAG TPA: methyltransferase domain-containing protein [Thermoanaerobaculia bacterium]
MSHPHPLSPTRWTAWLLALLVAIGAACAQAPAEHPAAETGSPGAAASAKREPANVMSWEKADWLEREGRAENEKPELVMQAMDLKPGMTVAEIGAGTGFFSRRIAKVVGPKGKVYAEDIQPQMLDLLKQNTAKEGVGNVVTVLGTETDPKLPAHSIDRVLLVDVYHEFQKPEPMLAAIRDCLAPGGTVTLVEYRLEGDTASHINIKHRMSVEQVLSEWTAAGFTLVRRSEDLPSQHVFIFSARRGARPPA